MSNSHFVWQPAARSESHSYARPSGELAKVAEPDGMPNGGAAKVSSSAG